MSWWIDNLDGETVDMDTLDDTQLVELQQRYVDAVSDPYYKQWHGPTPRGEMRHALDLIADVIEGRKEDG